MKLCAGRQPKFLAPGVCLLAFLSLPPMLAHLLFCRGLLAPQLLSGRVGTCPEPSRRVAPPLFLFRHFDRSDAQYHGVEKSI